MVIHIPHKDIKSDSMVIFAKGDYVYIDACIDHTGNRFRINKLDLLDEIWKCYARDKKRKV